MSNCNDNFCSEEIDYFETKEGKNKGEKKKGKSFLRRFKALSGF